MADHGSTLSLTVHLAMQCWSTGRNNFHQGVDMRSQPANFYVTEPGGSSFCIVWYDGADPCIAF